MIDLLTGPADAAAGLAVHGADAVASTAPAAVRAAPRTRGGPVAPADRPGPVPPPYLTDRPAGPARLLDAIGRWRA
ncbi:hypothetical protein [Micromonospora humida]|uniref:Uncharacterized protein n=1 Tax=Micromonospora humida TaxID=2809018 RepID=A0ABS2IV60_9ACTN|nr:hypothetical protein [Micromonospora humida]MBM7078186.1 hypothetical protein [Micromonospora humida]